jgi:hypothetical protein
MVIDVKYSFINCKIIKLALKKCNMRISYLITIVLFFVFSGFTVNYFFHEGALDVRGGHIDSKSNTYHYHHGCKAHQHKEGKCEFDFKNCEREKNDDQSHDHPIKIQN